MSYRIFLTGSGIAPEAQALLREHNCIFETGDPKDSPQDLARKVGAFDPHAMIVRQGTISAEVQAAAPSLRAICKHGVGTDNIDIAAASERGIVVLYTPRANFEAAAEHTFALIFALLRRLTSEDRRVRQGIFDKKNYAGQELLGKTLGLIGYGKIARRLAEMVAPFNVRVLVYHPSSTAEALPAHVRKVKEVEEIFAAADIISLHCPLTPATKGLIDRASIAQMKPGVLLINTARGGIIDEGDLLQALRDGHIAGAALDVFETEPPPADHPLFSLENVILSTHVAGVSDNSARNMGLDSVRQVLAALRDEPLDPEAVLNPEVLRR